MVLETLFCSPFNHLTRLLARESKHKNCFSSPKRVDRLCGQPSFHFGGCWRPVTENKAVGSEADDYLYLPRAEIKAWS